MGRYLYGERSGIYIIDLEKTLSGLEEAYAYARDSAAAGGDPVRRDEEAGAGGHLRARRTGRDAVRHDPVARRDAHEFPDGLAPPAPVLRELREMERTGAFDFLPKREAIRLRHEKEKLDLGGMQSLERLPDAIFVIDTKKEHIAVNEARKLGISVIAIVDTNCDPDEVDFVIPGNDDAIRSVSLVTRLIADALAEGRQEGRRPS